MSHVRTRRGGRPWFGRRQAKTDGRVTRRQDDVTAVIDQLLDMAVHEPDDERALALYGAADSLLDLEES